MTMRSQIWAVRCYVADGVFLIMKKEKTARISNKSREEEEMKHG